MVNILDERFMKPEILPDIENPTDCLTQIPPIALHHQDVLTYAPPYEQYAVVANIPYYITSPILFHFLYDIPHAPETMVIMMQEEVGEKILEGRARKPHHSYLSLAMELACEDIEIVRYVGRESFDPAPKVDSIVLKFQIKKPRDHDIEKRLLNLWKVAFTHPRKTLLSNLK
jgi:16S rRNA (adenine1518-N6/adenine1519-N6)-dimethyltransferase